MRSPNFNNPNDKNILASKTQLSNTNWDPALNCDNVNDGYSYFKSKITTLVLSLLNYLVNVPKTKSGWHLT